MIMSHVTRRESEFEAWRLCHCDDSRLSSAMATMVLPQALLVRRQFCSSSSQFVLPRFFSPAFVRRLGGVRCCSGGASDGSKQKLVFLGTPDVSDLGIVSACCRIAASSCLAFGFALVSSFPFRCACVLMWESFFFSVGFLRFLN